MQHESLPENQDNLKQTALHSRHLALNAKMVPFGGWSMPVQYPAGLLNEHKCVRTAVGLFDVSHMGELVLTGRGSGEFLQRMTTNDLSKLSVGQAQYNALCYENGTLVDDIVVYKRGLDSYFICVNASNIKKDYEWLLNHIPTQGVSLDNLSDSYAQIAIQGPKSRNLLASVSDIKLDSLAYYHFAEGKILGIPSIIARTGYTGELGYEIYFPTSSAEKIWNGLLEMGYNFGVLPCGLGARDTLRLEVGYLLYGNDMDDQTTALECGLGWITKFEKEQFIGKEALVKQKENGVEKKLVGFEMKDKAIGRHGYKVCNGENFEIGVVTSGSPSPTLGKNIGLAYVNTDHSKLGSEIFIDVRGNLKPAQIVNKSFYKLGSAQS